MLCFESPPVYCFVNDVEECTDVEGTHVSAVAGRVLLDLSDSSDLAATSFTSFGL